MRDYGSSLYTINHLPQSITTFQWINHFKSLHQLNQSNQIIFQPVLEVYDEILDEEISIDEVSDVLR